MKSKFFFIALIIMFTNLYSQKLDFHEKESLRYEFGIYGGINFFNGSESSYSPKLSFTYNYNSHWKFYLLTGYTYFTNPSYSKQLYYTNLHGERISSYSNSSSADYKFIPVEFGAKYILFEKGITPYLSINAGYDFYFSSGSGRYTNEVRNETLNIIENSSVQNYSGDSFSKFRIGVGIGVYIPVSKNIKLDLNYSYQRNGTFKDYHNINVGFGFSF